MAGTQFKVARMLDGHEYRLLFTEQRGDRVIRKLSISGYPTRQELTHVEAFLNARKCDCKKVK